MTTGSTAAVRLTGTSYSSFPFSDVFDKLRRHSAHDRIRGHVLRHDRTRPDDGIVSNGHPLQNGRVGTYPDIFPENDRGGKGMPARFGRQSVVERGKHHIVSDLAAVPDEDAAVVLKMAAGIDEISSPTVMFPPKSV